MNTIKDKQVKAALQALHKAADENSAFRMREKQEASEKGIEYNPSKKNAYMAVPPDEGSLLYFLADYSKAKQIVEFGCSFGISTIYLAAAAKNNGGFVTTTELEPNKVEAAQKNIEAAGLADFVNILQGDALQTLASVQEPIDFLFLDGAKELYLPVFNLLKDKLNDNAIVFADNAASPGAQPFVESILKAANTFTAVQLLNNRVLAAYYKK